MASRLLHRANAALERRLPERRLFIRSGDHTRFIRLRPGTQLAAWTGATVLVGWAIVGSAVVIMDSIGAGNFRAQALRDKMVYEDRLNAMSEERDGRAAEAVAAQDRFAAALGQVSDMQEQLLRAETRVRELETGLATVQATLRRAVDERDDARLELASLRGEGPGSGPGAEELEATLALLTGALADTAAERDEAAAGAEEAVAAAGDLDLEMRLMEERNDQIFRQLEDALSISVEPLDGMFRNAGIDPGRLIDEVRRGYSGQGGPLTPVVSTMGAPERDGATARANALLDRLDQLNLYRIAAERVPFASPLQDSYRLTSAFGPRWNRQHEGLDMAGPLGTAVYAPADGVVIFAGWSSGYGRLIKIQHEFGIETRYAHLNAIRVEVGQRVSRGERIGDTGNSGRSTGPHLHYEVRVGGEAVNPITFMRAGDDVL